jgi:WD40 repeat protein/serine/threonine protein kinase
LGSTGPELPGPSRAAVPAPPGYEILGELGQGGMGVVYRASQVRLKRLVALKVIKSARGAEAERARFRAEAEAVARLQHPNIVAVHDVGESEGELFCALEYVAGGSLDRQLRGIPLAARDAARLVEILARAMHAAHQANVLHRDLKPANVLLADAGVSPGEWVPKVTDFGLAKFLDENAPGMTQADAVMGTPSYMAPEQARGQAAFVDRTADVYALGAILYECLTGRPPFRAASKLETLEQVRSQDAVPIRSLQPGVPRDLENVTLLCLHKDSRRRYGTALELAEDLRRFRAGEPVQARPVGVAERAAKWVRRRPATSALLALLFLTVTGFSALVVQRNWVLNETNDRLTGTNTTLLDTNGRLKQTTADLQEANGNLTAERNEVKRQLETARREGFAAQLSKAALLAERDPVAAAALLNDAQRCPPDLRDFTWELLYTASMRNRYAVSVGPAPGPNEGAFRDPHVPGSAAEAAFAGDDTLLGLLRVGDALRVRRFDAAAGTPLGELTIPGRPTLTADYRLAAVVTPAGELKRYDLAAGRAAGTWPLPGAGTGPAAFSDDLRLLATVDEGTKLRLWDATTGRLLHAPEGVQGAITLLAFSPGGGRLVTVERGADNPERSSVRVWDVAEGKPLLRLDGPFGNVTRLVFSPDDRLLAANGLTPVGRTFPELGLYDLTTGKRLALGETPAGDHKLLAFGPEGRSLILLTGQHGRIAGDANESNTLRIWDVAGDEPLMLANVKTFDASGFLSPDRRTLALGTNDGLRTFDTLTGLETTRTGGPLEKLRPIAFAPDGRELVTAGLKLWDLGAGRERLVLPGDGPVAFSPDGRKLAVHTGGRAFAVWDVSAEPLVGRPLPWNQPVVSLSLTPDGRTLAVLGGEIHGFPAGRIAELRLLDVPTGDVRATLYNTNLVTNTSMAAFSPDGRTLAWDLNGRLQFLDPAGRPRSTMTLAPTPPGGPPVARGLPLFAFVPGGQEVVLARGDAIEFHDPATGEVRGKLEAPGLVSTPPALTADGSRVAAGGPDGSTWAWDRAAGQRRDGPFRHQGPVQAVAVHPSGGQVASAGGDGLVTVWNLADNSHRVLRGHQGPVTGLAYSPGEGRTLVSAGEDGTVRCWDPVTGQGRATFSRHTFAVTALAFSADGSALVTGSEGRRGGELLLWPSAVPRGERARLAAGDPVVGLALAPDGKAAATLSPNGRVRLWELPTARELDAPALPARARPGPVRTEGGSVLELALDAGHKLSLTALHSSPQAGPRLFRWDQGGEPGDEVTLPALSPASVVAYAPAARTGLVAPNLSFLEGPRVLQQKHLDLATGEEKVLFELPGVVPVATTPDGKYLATRPEKGGGVRVCDALTGKLAWEERDALPSGYAFSPDGRWLSAVKGKQVRVLETATGKERLALADAQSVVSLQPVFSPDGRLLAVVEAGETVRVYDLESGDPGKAVEVAAAPKGGRRVTALAFAADSKHLFLGLEAEQGSVLVWDLAAAKEAARISLPSGAYLKVLPAPDRRTVLVDGPGPMKAWDWTTGKEVAGEALPGGSLTSGAFTPDGKSFVALPGDGTCQLWDAETWKVRQNLKPRLGGYVRFALTPDGKTLLLRDVEGVTVCDAATGEEKARRKFAHTLAIGPGDDLVAAPGGGALVHEVKQLPPPAEVQVRVGDDKDPRARYLGHTGTVRALVLTRDGKRAISGGSDRLIHVWETAGGKAEATLAGHQGAVTQLALAAAEDRLASAAEDGTVRVWDLSRKAELAVLTGLTDGVRALAFSGDGQLVAAGGDDLVLRVLEADTGRVRAAFRGHEGTVTDAAFLADGRQVVSSSADGTVRVWDVPGPEGSKPDRPPPREQPAAVPVALAPDGQTLYRGLADGTVQAVDLATKQPRDLGGRHAGAVLAVALSPDGKTLATGAPDGTVKLFDPATGQERAAWDGHTGPVRALAWAPDGQTLASGEAWSADLFGPLRPGAVLLREAATGRTVAVLRGHRGGVLALAFAPDGQTLASGGDDALALVWDVASAAPRLTLRCGGPVGGVTFSADGKRLATGGQNGTTYHVIPMGGLGYAKPVRVWDPATGAEMAAVPTSGDTARALVTSPDGRLLAGAQDDGSVTLWEFATRRELAVLWAHEGPAHHLAFSADGKTLASAGADGRVCVYDVDRQLARPVPPAPLQGGFDAAALARRGELLVALVRTRRGTEVKVLETATGRERTAVVVAPRKDEMPASARGLLAVTADGKVAALVPAAVPATPPADDVVRLWDLEAGKELPTPHGGKGPVTGLAFAPGEPLLAWAAGDKIVRLWDPVKGEQRQEIPGLAQPARSLAFSPDGKLLAAGVGGTVKLWDPGSGKELASLRLAEDPPSQPGAPPAAGPVVGVAFSPDGKLLATATALPGKPDAPASAVKLWAVGPPASGGTVSLQERLALPRAQAGRVGFGPDGRSLVVVEDRAVRTFDVATGRPLAQRTPDNGVALLDGGSLLACLTNREEVHEALPIVFALAPQTGFPRDSWAGGRVVAPAVLALSPDRKAVLTAGRSPDDPTAVGPVTVWEVTDRGGADPVPAKPLRTLEGTGPVRLALLAAGGRAALGDDEGRVRTYGADGKPERTLALPGGPVTALAAAEDWLAAAAGKHVRVWKLPGCEEQAAVTADDAVTALAASPDGSLLAVGDAAGAVRLFDAGGKAVANRKGLTGPVSALGFSADGKRLAGGTRTGGIQVWDADGRPLLKPWVVNAPVAAFGFSANARLLAVATERGGQVLEVAGTRKLLDLQSWFHQRIGFLDDGKLFVLVAFPQSTRLLGTVELVGEGGRFGEPRLVLPTGPFPKE